MAKNAYGLDRIPAKLKATSESWIAAIFPGMNPKALMNMLPGHLGAFFQFILCLACARLDHFTLRSLGIPQPLSLCITDCHRRPRFIRTAP